MEQFDANDSVFVCKMCPETVFDDKEELEDHFYSKHVVELAPRVAVERRVLNECLQVSRRAGFAQADSVVALMREMVSEITRLRFAHGRRQSPDQLHAIVHPPAADHPPRPAAALRPAGRFHWRCDRPNCAFETSSPAWRARHLKGPCGAQSPDEEVVESVDV